MNAGSESALDEEPLTPAESANDDGKAFTESEWRTLRPASRPTVLLVEDDFEIRETLAEILHFEGYDVIEAANGLEALRAVRELDPAPFLVLLDLMMPLMSGEELLRALRAEQRVPRIPVVVLSATTPSHDEVAGARLCLHKPISYPTLMHVVELLCTLPPPTTPPMTSFAAG